MKLFIYDSKHEQVLGELELGKITAETITKLSEVITFLSKKEVTNEYGELVLSHDYVIETFENKQVIIFQ